MSEAASISSRPNRRRHARVTAPGIASHLRCNDTIALALPVENISLGGMFVSCPNPYPKGTKLHLELFRPGRNAVLKMDGQVVGTLPEPVAETQGLRPGMGIHFQSVSEDTAEGLRELLLELMMQSETAARLAAQAEFSPLRVDSRMEEVRRRTFDYDFTTLEAETEPAAPRVLPVSPSFPRNLATAPALPPDLADLSPNATIRFGVPALPAVEPQAAAPTSERLRLQLQGVLLELGEANNTLTQVKRERDSLATENARLRTELAHRYQWIAQLEEMVRDLQDQ